MRLGEIGGLLATVAISVLTIELALTALITPRLLLAGSDPWQAIWEGLLLRHLGVHEHRIRAARRRASRRSPPTRGCCR